MSYPVINTAPAYDLPEHLLELVDQAWLDRQAKTYAEVQRRKQLANPANPYEFNANQWNRWINRSVTL